MKISSASKKVLASALSAAMVVAFEFAPAVAIHVHAAMEVAVGLVEECGADRPAGVAEGDRERVVARRGLGTRGRRHAEQQERAARRRQEERPRRPHSFFFPRARRERASRPPQ